MAKLEFYPVPYGFPGFLGFRRYFPVISPELEPADELIPWGHCKVARIDNFQELKGARGALLDWPWLKKAKFQMIVRIKHGEYREGGFVQVVREKRSFRIKLGEPEIIDFRYYARPMTNRVSQLSEADLNPPTKELFKKLDPIFVSEQ